jgi:hypothetical protein
MFNSVILDVFIGLIFIYLLYSLLATVIQELIATYLGLRAKTLAKGIARMLDDEIPQQEGRNLFLRLNSLLMRILGISYVSSKNKDLSNIFYEHPLIKYLGSGKNLNKPAYLTGQNFAKVMTDLLRGDQIAPGDNTSFLIQNSLSAKRTNWGSTEISQETLTYLKSIWADAQGDVEKFKETLAKWFDDTMERATGWYKKQTQLILLLVGLVLATVFNVDTFVIVKKLSNDQNARNNLVSMANAYIESEKTTPADTTKIKATLSKPLNPDSLLAIKKQLDEDILKANTLLGIGGWPPDTVKILKDKKTKKVSYSYPIDLKAITPTLNEVNQGQIIFNPWRKIDYISQLFYYHLFGFLVTALAISLGAPFWFDLLNKLMQLRTSKKESLTRAETAVANTQPITLNLNNQTSEEAVG